MFFFFLFSLKKSILKKHFLKKKTQKKSISDSYPLLIDSCALPAKPFLCRGSLSLWNPAPLQIRGSRGPRCPIRRSIWRKRVREKGRTALFPHSHTWATSFSQQLDNLDSDTIPSLNSLPATQTFPTVLTISAPLMFSCFNGYCWPAHG